MAYHTNAGEHWSSLIVEFCSRLWLRVLHEGVLHINVRAILCARRHLDEVFNSQLFLFFLSLFFHALCRRTDLAWRKENKMLSIASARLAFHFCPRGMTPKIFGELEDI